MQRLDLRERWPLTLSGGITTVSRLAQGSRPHPGQLGRTTWCRRSRGHMYSTVRGHGSPWATGVPTIRRRAATQPKPNTSLPFPCKHWASCVATTHDRSSAQQSVAA